MATPALMQHPMAGHLRVPLRPTIPTTTMALPGTKETAVPQGFLERSDEIKLARGVARAANKTETYIRTPKLKAAIKAQVDELIEKYNDHILGLLERIEDLQNALRESDRKLAAANQRLIDLFGTNNRDTINDTDIKGLFDEWKDLQNELDTVAAQSGGGSGAGAIDVGPSLGAAAGGQQALGPPPASPASPVPPVPPAPPADSLILPGNS